MVFLRGYPGENTGISRYIETIGKYRGVEVEELEELEELEGIADNTKQTKKNIKKIKTLKI